MTVCICPNCNARYNIPASKLGENGRNVKCAKCGQNFFAAPETVSTQSLPTEATPSSSPETPAPATEEIPAIPEIPRADPTPGILESLPSADTLAPKLEQLTTLKHQPTWFRQLINSPFMWLGFATLAFTGLAIFSVLKMTTSTPILEPLTEETTPTDAITPSALALSDIKRDLSQRGDTWILTISGMVTNNSTKDVTVPEIRIQLLDPNNIALDFWPAEVAGRTLGPNQSSPWQARFLNPPVSRLASFRAYFRDADGKEQEAPAKEETSIEKTVDHTSKTH